MSAGYRRPGLPHGDTISAYIIQVSAAFGKGRGAEKTLSNAKICTKKHESGAETIRTAFASKEKRSMDEKLGVLFWGPGPCSLPGEHL